MSAIDVGRMRPFPCFREFSADDLAATAARLEEVRLAPGQTLFKQGEAGDASYMLVAGRIDIVIAVNGQVDHTFLLEPGAIFGEIAPLLGQTRTGGAVARDAAELWRLPVGDFRAALGRGEAWSVKLLLATAQTLASRLVALDRQMTQSLADLRRQPAPPRVAELEALRRRLMTEWAF